MISTNCSLQDWRHKKPTEMDCADGGENYEIPEKGDTENGTKIKA